VSYGKAIAVPILAGNVSIVILQPFLVPVNSAMGKVIFGKVMKLRNCTMPGDHPIHHLVKVSRPGK